METLREQQLQNLITQQASLKEELTTKMGLENTLLNQEESELNSKLQDIKRDMAYQNNVIKLVEDEINKLVTETKLEIALQEQDVLKKQAIAKYIIPSQIIRQPSASIKPTGPGKALILALSIIIGGFLAIFIVLLREMLVSAKQQIAVR